MVEDAEPTSESERADEETGDRREGVVAAGRWVYEVLRGFTWGRHLDTSDREK